MNKSDFERDTPAWIEVDERMHRMLGPLARRLASQGETAPPESALRVAEQVRKLLAQALRLTDASDAFSGFAAAPSQPRAPEEGLPLEASNEADPDVTPPEPRIPPPGPARERGRRGFGLIVIRPLDPSVRSTTLIEDGTRVVVINSRFPLFRERRGDMWYQLETAVREVSKLADPSNVADYERRVNELIVAAAALRGRRRRPPRAGRQLELPQ